MGLAHSARQGESWGGWRWSRGHYVSAFGETPRFGTIMTYGRRALGGVFSDPAADCGGVACGVQAGEPDGADAVTTLKILRFQVVAHRDPAADTDGDSIVDAGDAAPDDPDEWLDRDGDGVGDNADPDDDNDGTEDADDDVRDLSPFRDPALRALVEKALGKEAGAEITAGDMASLTELHSYDDGIRNLTGLEMATGLERLRLRRPGRPALCMRVRSTATRIWPGGRGRQPGGPARRELTDAERRADAAARLWSPRALGHGRVEITRRYCG